MRHITEREVPVYHGVLRRNVPQRLKRYLKIFAICNLLAFLILPKVFYGFWGGIGSLTGYVIESRTNYMVRSKYGRTIADFRRSKLQWQETIKGLNPKEWIK